MNRAYVGKFDSVAVVRRLAAVTDHKKVFRHISPPLQLVATTCGL
jgi:hypothetical protein